MIDAKALWQKHFSHLPQVESLTAARDRIVADEKDAIAAAQQAFSGNWPAAIREAIAGFMAELDPAPAQESKQEEVKPDPDPVHAESAEEAK